MTEAQLQRHVINLAKLYGYKCFHFRPGMNRRGKWQTAVQGESGFPDLVIVGHGRVLFRELKAAGGKLRPEQGVCLQALIEAGADAEVWTTAEWPERIDKDLSFRP